jgi:hypothetical protein
MRRICLVGAIAVSSLAIGVATSSAKGHHHKTGKTAPTTPAPKPTVIKTTCHLALTIAVPAGGSSVLADATSGTMYGPISCSKGGAGVVSFPFTVASSGDIVGKSTAFYAAGSVVSNVDLTETSSAPPTPYVFGNAAFTGMGKITHGTGAYAGLTGSGAFTCTTPDSIHYSCILKVKGTLAPAA